MVKLDKVVPWGRNFDEYVRMFSLTAEDLSGRMIGCGDGPASFNAEATQQGYSVVSVDPLYQYSSAEIRNRVEETAAVILEQCKSKQDLFRWDDYIPDVEILGQLRLEAMDRFLEDYALGLEQERYIMGALPDISFPDASFDLALCSHFLFLYSDHLSQEEHKHMITEMLRIASEVRIFPVLKLGGDKSPHLAPVMNSLVELGYSVDLCAVNYEFLKGANQMLKIRRT